MPVVNKALTLLAVLTLSACVTGEKMSSVRPGMTKAQVIAILGQPDGYRKVDNQEILSWNNRLSSGWAWDRADYNVIVSDGKVVEYGQGQVRPKQNGTLVIVPLRPL